MKELDAEMLAGVLGQSRELVHLNLRGNDIETVRRGRLQASWRARASFFKGQEHSWRCGCIVNRMKSVDLEVIGNT